MAYKTDVITTKDGTEIVCTFIKHASLLFTFNGHNIYVDPVEQELDWSKLPKGDVILITHAHYDHLDTALIEQLSTPETIIVSNKESGLGNIIGNGEKLRVTEYLDIEAVPAYNNPEREEFHPNNGRDNGYVLNIGESTIYITGDTEPTKEMELLKGSIDYMFAAMNQPYTMLPEQVVEAIKMIKPRVLYPIHYFELSDIEKLKKLAENHDVIVKDGLF